MIRYHLRIYHHEQLWLPVGLWGLFAIIIAIMHDEAGRGLDMARAFLVFVLPLHLADGVQYRVVGQEVGAYPGAQAVQPSLEDGYVWLMQGGGT